MEVIVDGLIYEHQAYGGVSRLFNETMPRMCDIDPALSFVVVTLNRVRQAPPAHSRIVQRALFPIGRLLRPQRRWWPVWYGARAIVEEWSLRGSRRAIWHPTYYTLVQRWEGPTVITVFDMIQEHFPAFFSGQVNDDFRRRKRRCVSAADAVICISQATANDVADGYGVDRRRIHVVPLAPGSTFKALQGASWPRPTGYARPFILYVGARHAYKNFPTLLHAYAVWGRRTEVDLQAVGPQWSNAEARELRDLGLGERVHLLTDIDDNQLCALYNRATAFVYPSLYEGFGIPLVEAMAAGCPIVASRIPSTVEVAADCPIYFEPTDADALLAALEVALSEGRGSERTRRGIEVASRYSWDTAAKQVLSVYRALTF